MKQLTTKQLQKRWAEGKPPTHDNVEFALPITIQQADMLEALTALSPQQRTELVTDWYLFWINVHQGMRMVE